MSKVRPGVDCALVDQNIMIIVSGCLCTAKITPLAKARKVTKPLIVLCGIWHLDVTTGFFKLQGSADMNLTCYFIASHIDTLYG